MIKEPKPINRSQHIKAFSRDHHMSLLFCWKIRQGLKSGIAPDRLCKYVDYFWKQHLKLHFRTEEKILFSHLKDKLVQKAIKEHKFISEQIKSITIDPYNAIQRKLEKLVDLIDDHIRYEERTLFPHLERKLSLEQLQNVSEKTQNPSNQDLYDDQFWNL